MSELLRVARQLGTRIGLFTTYARDTKFYVSRALHALDMNDTDRAKLILTGILGQTENVLARDKQLGKGVQLNLNQFELNPGKD